MSAERRVSDSLFHQSSMCALRARLDRREIAPADVAEACSRRIGELDGTYRAFVCHDPALVREQAEAASRFLKDHPARPLEAMPVGVKDIMNTASYPTQMGSPIWRGFTPGNDARCVYNVVRDGAIVAGKADTAEFAVHVCNNAINPHDALRTPGTSSSGSAVAVATGMVPFALGTQTAGSIVRPASFCGIYGCKPSFGLIPRTGMLKTTDTLDSVGFFCVHLEDLRAVFDAVRVHGLNYPLSHAVLSSAVEQAPLSGADAPWKVAFVRSHTWSSAPDYARVAMAGFAARLAAHPAFRVEDVELPPIMRRTHEVHEVIYNKALSYYFQLEYQSQEGMSALMRKLIEHGARITPREYQEALDIQSQQCQAMDRFFGDYDLVVSLSTAGEAPLRGVEERPDPALMWTMTHLSVVSVPLFKAPSGLPFGMQAVARRYRDYKLFACLSDMCAAGLIPDRTPDFALS